MASFYRSASHGNLYNASAYLPYQYGSAAVLRAAPAVHATSQIVHAAPAVHVAAPQQVSVPLNHDPNPILVRKKPAHSVNYRQEVAVRFLKPGPLPPHGDILVKQEPDVQMAAPPPLHLRNQPPQPLAPPPLIIREKPPLPPPQIPEEVIRIPGKVFQQPRQVITENYAQIPPPPQKIIVERWLPYPEQVREVRNVYIFIFLLIKF